MILTTGGYGFIGSAVVRRLIGSGHTVLVVDDVTNGEKLDNLRDVGVAHYLDRAELLDRIAHSDSFLDRIERVVHLGARTNTTEKDGKLLFELNYRYSCQLLDFCDSRGLPFIYASSAAVYGRSSSFGEDPANERPLNPYAHSKLVFDNLVRDHLMTGPSSTTLGLRFFNVYGPGEAHKGAMASVIRHFHGQARSEGVVRPFGASHGYPAGGQARDFVHVDDVVSVILWALDASRTRSLNDIVNVGTGEAKTFESVAELVSRGSAQIEYREFPKELNPAYQPYTRADLRRLRGLGYEGTFRPIELGIASYLASLDEEAS